jgi:hypothetical protein
MKEAKKRATITVVTKRVVSLSLSLHNIARKKTKEFYNNADF